jgi:hypothetical protein
MTIRRLTRLCIALLAGMSCLLHARDVTFLSTSDSHYREPDHRLGHHNHLNRATVLEMNRITELSWPEKLGGEKIAQPRGVLMPGGSDRRWRPRPGWPAAQRGTIQIV